MVAVLDMRLLVGNDIGQTLIVHAEGQVDARTEKAEHERRGNLFALPKVIPQNDSIRDTAAQADITDDKVHEQRNHTDDPDGGSNICCDLHRVDACRGIWGKGFRNDRIDVDVECGNAAVYLRSFRIQNIRADRFRAWDQA
ncbi:hypothetical protein SDC9_78488 [bioreactor metagenome]|uniref:Uncharacterized protein n=1 Tax=bioreactor metagenome TaxID=1076179 RepID=A0A644YVQ8_9ZZZZ